MSFRAFTPLMACALALGASSDATAAWNNVFQVTCWNCRSQQASTSYYQPPVATAPVAAAGGSQQCNTSYVQRSYYEPVTTYENKSYYEPVTTYRTSYYYEPVTQCRTSYYYDPCSCAYKPVTSRETTYALKAQQCPVTSYVERCYQQPVTSYRLSYYYQPVTTCCTTTTGAPLPCLPQGGTGPSLSPAPAPVAPSTGQPPLANPAPAISEHRSFSPAAPGVNDSRTPGTSSFRPIQPAVPVSPERIASANGLVPMNGQLTGGLLNMPVRNANLWFVGTGNERIPANTDNQGRFSTRIPAGTWNVYMAGRDGGAKFLSTVAATGSTEPVRLALR